jgi:hypothetical protein
VQLRRGQYEVTVAMDLGGQAGLPQKDYNCITAEDLKDLRWLMRDESAKECKTSDVKTSPTRITFNMTCTVDGA